MSASHSCYCCTLPCLCYELALRNAGHVHVAGVDEAGRGPWAGPVCAAAVVLPLHNEELTAQLSGVRDSKMLSPSRREALRARILTLASGVGVGWAMPAEVDSAGIVLATERAMMRAIGALKPQPDALLIDFVKLRGCRVPQRSLPKADSICLSVAAASIIAKVSRDRLMTQLDRAYPDYGFAAHKGYGTAGHAEALARLGPCPVHRLSWLPVRRSRA